MQNSATLKSLRQEMEKALFLVNEAEIKKKTSKNPIEVYHANQEIDVNNRRAEFYVRKMLEHGGVGTVVKVSGEVWVNERGKARTTIKVKRKFQLLLSCVSMEDAKDIFEAQVFNTMEFVRETVTFRTIPLKHVNLI